MPDLSSLNENQKAAVEWADGPLLVLAGPGSGKTRVLTFRIARLLEESSGQHFKVLGLTFTNKAAAEMRGRIEELLPESLHRVRLTTFHSFAAELLQQHGSVLQIRPDFQILTNDADREAVLDEVLRDLKKSLSYGLPTHFKAAGLLPGITRLLDRCIPPDRAEAYLEERRIENHAEVAVVYRGYRDALRKVNALDFPSLIAEALDLLRQHAPLVKHIRKVYKHILVDEFQDTNGSQYAILTLLAKPDPSTLFVVADDDQIIYQWNGANPKRIEALRTDFSVSELQLPENYRCPPIVIELANALISKNLSRTAGKKPLKAVKVGCTTDETLRIFSFDDINGEAAWIANDILARLPEDQAQCAILGRTKKVVELAGMALQQAGLAVYFAARKDEFKSAPLRFLHAVLRLASSGEDRQSVARLSKAFFELEGARVELSDVIEKASADGMDLLRAWISIALERSGDLGPTTRALLGVKIAPLLNSLNYAAFAAAAFNWAEALRGAPSVEETAFDEYEEERDVWGQLQGEIRKKFSGEEVGLHQFLHELDLSSKSPPREPGAIPCFTIHASKGLEFGHVYLMAMVEDQLPSWAAVKKGADSIEMQEERRNCFVAITRSITSLTLTYSSQVFGWNKAPSRFLGEMGIEL